MKSLEEVERAQYEDKVERLKARLVTVERERDAARRTLVTKMPSEADQHTRQKHPAGWEPSVIEEGNFASAVSAPTTNSSPDEEELIRGWLLDPNEWQIVGPLNCRRWQRYDHEWLYYYKANLQRIDPLVHADTEALYKRIAAVRKEPKVLSGPLTFLVLIGDTQIGKGDGDGTPGTVERWLRSLDATIERFKELAKAGRPIGHIVVAFMGDMGESCDGNYAAQRFTTDLTMREQDGLLQELVFDTLKRLAALCDDMTVVVVPGNHGEYRIDGKLATTPSDNRDVAVIETVHRGIRRNENKAFDHVKFIYPASEELTVAIDLSGVPVGFAHGHQFGAGATPAKKAEGWWKDQAHGKTDVGDCTLLFSGHYHHLDVNNNGRKVHIQIPALDGGSQWWENLKAQVSPPGMVSVLIGEGVGPAGCGWDDLKVC